MPTYKTKIRTFCGGCLYEAGDVVPENVAKAIGPADCTTVKSAPPKGDSTTTPPAEVEAEAKAKAEAEAKEVKPKTSK